MIDRRELLKNLGLLTSASVLPFTDLLANDEQISQVSNELVPVLILPNEGERCGGYIRKITKQHTGGAFSSLETVLKNGFLGAPPHLHQALDEIDRKSVV